MGTLSLPAMWGGAAAAGGGTSSPPPLSEASPYGSTAFGGAAPSYDLTFGTNNGAGAGNGAAAAPFNDPLAPPQPYTATGPQANRVSLAEPSSSDAVRNDAMAASHMSRVFGVYV